jgi:hypothetical protein
MRPARPTSRSRKLWSVNIPNIAPVFRMCIIRIRQISGRDSPTARCDIIQNLLAWSSATTKAAMSRKINQRFTLLPYPVPLFFFARLALQARQRFAYGSASNLPLLIACPQLSQVPYVPLSIFSNAWLIWASISLI